jgi:hypothetical protein
MTMSLLLDFDFQAHLNESSEASDPAANGYRWLSWTSIFRKYIKIVQENP